ncbi:MAG TPA: 6-phosphofructokinase, partial [Candidatus Limnocylindrales bacterium]|nr:6-phosphofructokinase [Candidatus Limnocylindrales bacterium]
MTAARRIGILTGGGDVPGLNSVIKSVVYRATEIGDEVVGIRRGWEGLTHLRFDPAPDPFYVVGLDRNNTRTIDRTGGTWLHTSRTNPKKMKASAVPEWIDPEQVASMTVAEGVVDLTPVVLDNIERLGLDVLVTIGGDVPGLNSVIKSVVYRATEIGDEVIGIRRGWEGLTHLRFDPTPDPFYVVGLDRNNTRTIDRTGGTWL